jgi:endonuclease-3
MCPSSPYAPASERLPEIVQRLKNTYPDARCTLDHTTPFELLVATMLATQCPDERVNRVTPALFARYPTATALAEAERSELEDIIRPTGHSRQKSRFLRGTARVIVQEHNGEVPADMGALLKMPGLSRNTASFVLGVAFGLAEGIVVDSHVKRLAKRLKLTRKSETARVERDLMALVPREDWVDFAHLLVFHGKKACKARKPDCTHCVLDDLCPWQKNKKD